MRHPCVAALLALALLMGGARTGTCRQSNSAGQGLNDGSIGSSARQSPTALSPHGEKIKSKVLKMGLGSNITVIIEDGDDLYGSISKVDERTFEIVEVDLKQRVTINYEQVKKVRSGYGGKGANGHRPNPRVNYAVFGGLLVFLIVVAAVVGGS